MAALARRKIEVNNDGSIVVDTDCWRGDVPWISPHRADADEALFYEAISMLIKHLLGRGFVLPHCALPKLHLPRLVSALWVGSAGNWPIVSTDV